MRKQAQLGVCIVSLLLVLGATASVAVRVGLGQAQGRKAAREDFARLTTLLGPVATAADLGAPGLRDDLVRLFATDPDLLLVSVYERGTGVVWRLPADSPYLPAQENQAPIPQPRYPPQSAHLLAAPLPADVSGRLAVDALYVILPQATLFEAFRDASLGLGALLLVLLVIAFASGSRKARVPPPSATDCLDDPELSGCDAIYASPVEDEFAVPDLAGDLGVPEEEEVAESGDAEERVDTPVPGAEDLPPPERLGSPEGNPGGLFSPLSGLGWESYLDARLDAELARSASFEQDLSLLLVRIGGLSPEKPAYKALASSIGQFFSFRDLAFERGPDGFAVILPNIDAEHGLRMAEEFHRKAISVLDAGTPQGALAMGLSSRAGRLVDAARLGQEAASALAKAAKDKESRIVAFRPDPDRYRIFLQSKGL